MMGREEIKIENSIYKKLQEARVKLQSSKLKKSGKNKFSGFQYFEIGDFLPKINEIFNELGLCSNFSIKEKVASLTITDCDNLEQIIVFESPVASADLKGSTPIQSLGAVHTYMKRYLYLNALEIVENDILDDLVSKNGIEIPKQYCEVCGKEVNQKIADKSIEKFGKVFCGNDCANSEK